MSKEILKCFSCNIYTLKKQCPNCGKDAITPKPTKFSVLDRFSYYRRKYKDEMENKENQKN